MQTHAFQMRRLQRETDWLRIAPLYMRAFPPSERKPLAMIRSRQRSGRTDVWLFFLEGRFAGFAATVNSPDLILLDYLAVSPRFRGRGTGSAALQALKDSYPDKGLFVEIESIYHPQNDLALRKRRRAFYLRCGMQPLNVAAEVFGVPMELLGWRCEMDFQAYRTFYHDHNSPMAARHVLPLDIPHSES